MGVVSVLAMTRAFFGALTTTSPWLIHTLKRRGNPEKSGLCRRVKLAKPYSLVFVFRTFPPNT